jgi:hypothetical protein
MAEFLAVHRDAAPWKQPASARAQHLVVKPAGCLVIRRRPATSWQRSAYPSQLLRHASAVVTLLILTTILGSAANAATGTRYLCTRDGRRSFSETPQGVSCSVLHDEPGWTAIVSSPNFIVSYHPASVVREGDTVTAGFQVNLASPVSYVGSDGSDKFQYDSIRASYRFYCLARQQVLIQGTYKLGTKNVHERLSSEAILEEIKPNTIAETLLKFFCHGNRSEGAPSPVTMP